MKNSLGKELFVKKSNKIHNYKYDYSDTIYINNKTHVYINCQIHGKFKQVPQSHLRGSGCMECANYNKKNKNFIEQANLIHNNKYDYSETVYVKRSFKVKIICTIHGPFFQRPADHLACKKACPICYNQQLDVNKFIVRANIIHDNIYKYTDVIYKNMHTKVKIKCLKHGIFSQTPINHLSGTGCPKCFLIISKKEIEWLDYLEIPAEYRHKTIKIDSKNYYVDAYDYHKKIIYEFYGDYWHGNPNKYLATDVNSNNKKSFGELYQLTIKRENIFKNNGYNIISIWEDKWNLLRTNIKIGA